VDTELLKRPELIYIFNVVVDKIGSLLTVIAVTYLLALMTVWLLNLASNATTKYRLYFQGFIPSVKVFYVVSALAGILLFVLNLQRPQLVFISGVAVIAIGLSSRELVSSAIAHISIVWNRPFQIGDRIKIGETYGQVTDISLAHTKLMTPGDSVVTIPNHVISNSIIINTNYGSLQSMAEIDFFLASSEDPKIIKRILWEAAVTSKFLYLEEPVIVLATQLPFYTRYRVKAYTYDTRTEFRFMSDVTETAKSQFNKQGIKYATAAWNEKPAGDN
jgi:small-conductance mechanosensitive channel